MGYIFMRTEIVNFHDRERQDLHKEHYDQIPKP